jgi:5-methyltetrahydrofolate--homocysteine methyltransferase
MLSMGDTIQALKAAGLREKVHVGIGGATVTQRFADEIGADFYSPTATVGRGQGQGADRRVSV